MRTTRKSLSRWLLLVGTAAALGAGTAYARNAEVMCCYPCTCLPNGNYGTCCGAC